MKAFKRAQARAVVSIAALVVVYGGILVGKAASTTTVYFRITSDFDGCVLYRGEGEPRHPLVVSARTATVGDFLTVVRWDDAPVVSGLAPMLPTVDIVADVKADTVIDYTISAPFWRDKELVAAQLEKGLGFLMPYLPPETKFTRISESEALKDIELWRSKGTRLIHLSLREESRTSQSSQRPQRSAL